MLPFFISKTLSQIVIDYITTRYRLFFNQRSLIYVIKNIYINYFHYKNKKYINTLIFVKNTFFI